MSIDKDTPAWRCPDCHGTNVERGYNAIDWINLNTGVEARDIEPGNTKRIYCNDCGDDVQPYFGANGVETEPDRNPYTEVLPDPPAEPIERHS